MANLPKIETKNVQHSLEAAGGAMAHGRDAAMHVARQRMDDLGGAMQALKDARLTMPDRTRNAMPWIVAAVVAGVGIGVVAWLVLDPKHGEERRDAIADAAMKARDAATDAALRARQAAEDAALRAGETASHVGTDLGNRLGHLRN